MSHLIPYRVALLTLTFLCSAVRQLSADQRLGRIATALVGASGFSRARGAQPRDFVALLGALLLAACLLRRGRMQQLQQAARVRHLAKLRQQWQHAAAAMAMMPHRSYPAAAPHPVLMPQRFRVVLA